MNFNDNHPSESIDPEVLPPYSKSGDHSLRYLPKWAIFLGLGTSAVVASSTTKYLFPLVCFGLLAGIALRKVGRQ